MPRLVLQTTSRPAEQMVGTHEMNGASRLQTVSAIPVPILHPMEVGQPLDPTEQLRT